MCILQSSQFLIAHSRPSHSTALTYTIEAAHNNILASCSCQHNTKLCWCKCSGNCSQHWGIASFSSTVRHASPAWLMVQCMSGSASRISLPSQTLPIKIFCMLPDTQPFALLYPKIPVGICPLFVYWLLLMHRKWREFHGKPGKVGLYHTS